METKPKHDMRYILIALISASVVLLNSCKKDKDESAASVPSNAAADYTPFKTGNYWVYERYQIDSSGNATAKGVFDSTYVTGDTVINGNTYYKWVKPDYYSPALLTYLIRDSLAYLVTHTADILFSSVDFNTIFKSYYVFAIPDTICNVVFKMESKDVPFTTPAGTFITSDARTAYYMTPAFSFNGSERFRHNRYGANIGVVTETFDFFLSSPNYTERRLIRYHLN